MPSELPPPGRYRHFKGGEYEVLGTARHSETGEWLVVYRPQTGNGSWWVRPAEMFAEVVEFEGHQVVRFVQID